jgi:preprotein translocase subunit SecD
VSNNIGLRSAIYAVLTIVALVYLVPTFSTELPSWWKVLPTKKVKLGLDLRGGMRLKYEVDSASAVKAELDMFVDGIKDNLREKKIRYSDIKSNSTNGIDLTLLSDQDLTSFDGIKNLYPDYNVENGEKTENGQVVHMNLKPAAIQEMLKNATGQAKETIDNRLNQYGLSETEVTADTDLHRILIQIPGEKDLDKAMSLIGKTAQLEFKLVDDANSLEEAKKGNIPAGDEILYSVKSDSKTGSTTKEAYLVKKHASLTGSYIANAYVKINNQTGQPYVELIFNDKGSRLFERLTGENVGRYLAIILDNNVYSAPVINDKISGTATITGNYTSDEANELKVVLKAGALPAKINLIEQRTVGPSLGKDSINKGILSFIIGTGLVVLFMIVYYGFSGLIADFALVLNTLFIMAGLAFFGATLTLPGLAGLILLIGMCVDTNVLIYERMREELRLGKTLRTAMETGYSKTMVTIIDTHVTTILSGIVLYQFGTGPVRGFAVTLTIGLFANFLTAIFITRVIFDYLIIERRWKKISV